MQHGQLSRTLVMGPKVFMSWRFLLGIRCQPQWVQYFLPSLLKVSKPPAAPRSNCTWRSDAACFRGAQFAVHFAQSQGSTIFFVFSVFLTWLGVNHTGFMARGPIKHGRSPMIYLWQINPVALLGHSLKHKLTKLIHWFQQCLSPQLARTWISRLPSSQSERCLG